MSHTEKEHKGNEEYMGTGPYSEGAVGILKVLLFSRGRKFSFGINAENLILSHVKAACRFWEILPNAFI